MLKSEIQNFLWKKREIIFDFFSALEQETPFPFMASSDLRFDGHRVVPVDCNLFPAGFNNLSSSSLRAAAETFEKLMSARHPNCKKLLVIAESHSRNRFYLENLACLTEMFGHGDLEKVFVGVIASELEEPVVLKGVDRELKIFPVRKEGTRLYVNGSSPCMVLLNNDLSDSGKELEILKGLSQPVFPSPEMGWHQRRKSNFHSQMKGVADALAEKIGGESRWFSPETEEVKGVDFVSGEGMEALKEIVGKMFQRLKERGNPEPYVLLKNNHGTYGMGILCLQNEESIERLNRKDRNKMAMGKGGVAIREVIVQEGIETVEEWEGNTAERVFYTAGSKIMGGFYRTHQKKGVRENLNSRGMIFHSFDWPSEVTEEGILWEVAARVSLAAAAAEIKQHIFIQEN